jgi:hypothetical protein
MLLIDGGSGRENTMMCFPRRRAPSWFLSRARRRTQQKVSEHTAINYSRTTYTIQQLEKVVWAETTEARPNLTNFTCFTFLDIFMIFHY